MFHREITFIGKFGSKSWYVRYDGPYDNQRPQHVELRKDKNSKGGIYNTMQEDTVYKISGLKKTGNSVMWNIVDLQTEEGKQAHFTVHYGPRPVQDFMPFGIVMCFLYLYI